VKQAAQDSTDRQRKLFDDVVAECVEVDVKRVRVERCRKFGGPWLGLQVMSLLGLDEFFAETGREDIPWPMMSPCWCCRGLSGGDCFAFQPFAAAAQA